jgi:hypothetical protein
VYESVKWKAGSAPSMRETKRSVGDSCDAGNGPRSETRHFRGIYGVLREDRASENENEEQARNDACVQRAGPGL